MKLKNLRLFSFDSLFLILQDFSLKTKPVWLIRMNEDEKFAILSNFSGCILLYCHIGDGILMG